MLSNTLLSKSIRQWRYFVLTAYRGKPGRRVFFTLIFGWVTLRKMNPKL